MVAHLKKHIQAAAIATGNGAVVSDIWTSHKGGADIERAFIDARGFTNLEAEALDAEAEAAEAVEAHRVAAKADRPSLAATATKKKAAVKTARDKADKAQAETRRFLEALNAAESKKESPDPAIAKAKERADEQLQAVKEIAQRFGDDVAEYTAATILLTGDDPTDDPDALATAVGRALVDAETHHASLLRAAEANDLPGINAAATLLADAHKAAKAAREDLTERSDKLGRKKLVDDAKEKFSQKAKIEAEAEKAEKEKEAAANEEPEAKKENRLSRFINRWQNQLRVMLVSTLVGLLLPAPLLHVAVGLAVIVAAVMIASWIMDGNAGKKAVGVHAVIVGTMAVWVFMAVPLMEWRSSGSDAGIIPSLTTAEPTRSSEEAVSTFETMFEPYPTNTPSPTEEPDN